jgi:hypothetical protein
LGGLPGRARSVGGNLTPIILQWNFSSNRRIARYIPLTGGGLDTRVNVPPVNRFTFNFVAGGSIGFHVFVRKRRAISLETRWVQISNAKLGVDNPQLVSNFAFTAGYNC